MISHTSNKQSTRTQFLCVAILATSFFVHACGGSSAPDSEPADPSTDPTLSSSAEFDLSSPGITSVALTEGDQSGVSVPLQITRTGDSSAEIRLSARGINAQDARQLTFNFADEVVSGADLDTSMTLSLGIGALPLAAHERKIVIEATDGSNVEQIELSVNVEPSSAPDVYLLVGQSNMVGFSGDGTKDASPGGPDEPNPRIKQLHVTFNDEVNFVAEIENLNINRSTLAPAIITAEDPLHEPLNGAGTGKAGDFIGLGLSFAKAALENTTADIILVPAAWSGSAFCDNNNGPSGQWNANETDDPTLGNTRLFDRAVSRTNEAIERTGGVLRGILWHQGEADANTRCAQGYLANLELLAQEFRSRVNPDLRGDEFRRPDSPIPFVVGTMSRGFDDRADLSVFNDEKQLIDDYHRQIPSQIPFVGASIHDDLVGSQWPCGNTTCIHFGAEALREIGNRYYQQLQSAMSEFNR